MNTPTPQRPVSPSPKPVGDRSWRDRAYEIIFEADTPAGKTFDIAVLVAILLSIAVISLESVRDYRKQWNSELEFAGTVFTVLFTIEYILRLWCVRRPWRYALSFYGIVDLLAILPAYLAFFVDSSHYLAMVRALRLLRVFHVFKMGPYVEETRILVAAMRATKAKIVVFLLVVLTAVLLLGTAIYVVENPHPDQPDPGNEFTSIPRSVYWAVVTLTTVGYGDIAPQSVPGQILAATAMILGYSMIIVPVAIFSVEVIQTRQRDLSTRTCPSCVREGHDSDAEFCKYCGATLATER
jgi:voltage-gated potassium channel